MLNHSLGIAVFDFIFNLSKGLQCFTPKYGRNSNNKIRDFLLITVKNCEELQILSYVPANKSACQFHGSWQKTRVIWIKDKEPYWSEHSEKHNLHIQVPLRFPWRYREVDSVGTEQSKLASQLRNLRLRKLKSSTRRL